MPRKGCFVSGDDDDDDDAIAVLLSPVLLI
jgi:hypothetical protein